MSKRTKRAQAERRQKVAEKKAKKRAEKYSKIPRGQFG
jgi:hypothetical protein